MGWFWPLSSWSSTTHGHPVRSPGSVSLAIWEADRRCPVSATGLKSSLHPWIFHLWISQNQCSVFAFPDWDHGSAFPFTTPHLSLFLRGVCVRRYSCVYIFLIFLNLSLLCLPLENHNPFCHCFIFLLFLLFSLIAYFYHACTSGISSLTMRLTFNSRFFFFFFT